MTVNIEQDRSVSKGASAPALRGYTFRWFEACDARDNNRLLSLWLETNSQCALRCRHCARGPAGRREADTALLKDLAAQAKGLGCSSIVLPLGPGDPLLFSGLRELVGAIDSLGIIPVIFTSGAHLSDDLVGFLFRHNASILVKFDSFVPEIQDHLTGTPGAYNLIRGGLQRLISAGFNAEDSGVLRLGAVFTLDRMNAGETGEFLRFCRRSRIYPQINAAMEDCRQAYSLPAAEINQVKHRLLGIDRHEYGYDWEYDSPLAGAGCARYLYSMYVTLEGNARPCPRTAFDQHANFWKDGEYPLNVRKKELLEIYYSGPMYYCRHIDSFLNGKCRDSGFPGQCIGCRGSAYISGINSGMGPLQAMSQACRHCFK